jgi:hypothetical protein
MSELLECEQVRVMEVMDGLRRGKSVICDLRLSCLSHVLPKNLFQSIEVPDMMVTIDIY